LFIKSNLLIRCFSMDKLKLKRLYSLKKKLIKRYLQWHLKLL